MQPYLILAGLLAIIGAYFYGRHDGLELAQAQELRDQQVARIASDSAQRAAAEAIAGIEVRNTTIRQTLEREIREKPVYLDCRHTSDGLRIVNAALTGRAYSASHSQLSGTVATE